MKLHKKNEKGFTLIELLLGIVIMVLIMGGISTLFASSVKVHSISTAKASNIKDASTAINNIADELRYALSPKLTLIMPDGTTKSEGTVDNANSYTLTNPVTVPDPTLTNPTNHGIQFTRDILKPTTSGGDGVQTTITTRRIRLINNTAVMDYGPITTAQTSTWKIIRSIDLSTGTDLVATEPLSGIPLYSGAIQSLVFKLEEMPDVDVTNVLAKRKKITITIVANDKGFNAGPKNETLNTTSADTTARKATFTTTIVTNN